ncbi:MAG: hypothetical protein MMC33_000613 [Icmadophila ericetorum]|nr:hypothetical protein [Icmadophila ericetorum]
MSGIWYESQLTGPMTSLRTLMTKRAPITAWIDRGGWKNGALVSRTLATTLNVMSLNPHNISTSLGKHVRPECTDQIVPESALFLGDSVHLERKDQILLGDKDTVIGARVHLVGEPPHPLSLGKPARRESRKYTQKVRAVMRDAIDWADTLVENSYDEKSPNYELDDPAWLAEWCYCVSDPRILVTAWLFNSDSFAELSKYFENFDMADSPLPGVIGMVHTGDLQGVGEILTKCTKEALQISFLRFGDEDSRKIRSSDGSETVTGLRPPNLLKEHLCISHQTRFHLDSCSYNHFQDTWPKKLLKPNKPFREYFYMITELPAELIIPDFPNNAANCHTTLRSSRTTQQTTPDLGKSLIDQVNWSRSYTAEILISGDVRFDDGTIIQAGSAMVEHIASETSSLGQLAAFLRSEKDGTGQIAIPDDLGNAIQERISSDTSNLLPSKEVASVVKSLESQRPSLCGRLSVAAFIIVFAVLKASEKCWPQCRGLHLLAESIHGAEPPPTTTRLEPPLRSTSPLSIRKQRLAIGMLPHIFGQLEYDKESIKIRRGMGLLALELLRGLRFEQGVAEAIITDQDFWRVLGQMLLGEPNEQLRFVAGIIMRELISNGFAEDKLWPTDLDPVTYHGFPVSDTQDSAWVFAFRSYLNNIVSDLGNENRQFSELATTLQFDNGQKIDSKDCPKILVTTGGGKLSILVPLYDNPGSRIFDIPLNFISGVFVEDFKPPRSKKKSRESAIIVAIHLKPTISPNPNIYIDAVGGSMGIVKVTFDAKTIGEKLKSALRDQERVEKRTSRSEVLDVSVTDDENAVDDPVSTAYALEELTAIASKAERLILNKNAVDGRRPAKDVQPTRNKPHVIGKAIEKLTEKSRVLRARNPIMGDVDVATGESAMSRNRTNNGTKTRNTDIAPHGINTGKSTPKNTAGRSSFSLETQNAKLLPPANLDLANSTFSKCLQRPDPKLIHKGATTGLFGSSSHRGRTTYRPPPPNETSRQVATDVQVKTTSDNTELMAKTKSKRLTMGQANTDTLVNESTSKSGIDPGDVFEIPQSPKPKANPRAIAPANKVSKKAPKSTKPARQTRTAKFDVESHSANAETQAIAETNDGLAGPSKSSRAAVLENDKPAGASPEVVQDSFGKADFPRSVNSGGALPCQSNGVTASLATETAQGVGLLGINLECQDLDSANLERFSAESEKDPTIEDPMQQGDRRNEETSSLYDSHLLQGTQYFEDAMVHAELNRNYYDDILPLHSDQQQTTGPCASIIDSHKLTHASLGPHIEDFMSKSQNTKMSPQQRPPKADGKSRKRQKQTADPMAVKLNESFGAWLDTNIKDAKSDIDKEKVLRKNNQEAVAVDNEGSIEEPSGPAKVVKMVENTNQDSVRLRKANTVGTSNAFASRSKLVGRAEAPENSDPMSSKSKSRHDTSKLKRKAADLLESHISKQRNVSPLNTPRQMRGDVGQESNQQTTDERTNRKPAMISFSGKGPRNQGVSSKKLMQKRPVLGQKVGPWPAPNQLEIDESYEVGKDRLKRTQAIMSSKHEDAIDLLTFSTTKPKADLEPTAKKQKANKTPAIYNRPMILAARASDTRSSIEPEDGSVQFSDHDPGHIVIYESLGKSSENAPPFLRELPVLPYQISYTGVGTPENLGAKETIAEEISPANNHHSLPADSYSIVSGPRKQFSLANKENHQKSQVQRASANRQVTRQMTEQFSSQGSQISPDPNYSAPGAPHLMPLQRADLIKQTHKAPQRPSSPRDPFAAPNSQSHESALTQKFRRASTKRQQEATTCDVIRKPSDPTVRAEDPDKTLVQPDSEPGDGSSSNSSPDSHDSSNRKQTNGSISRSKSLESSRGEDAVGNEIEPESYDGEIYLALAAVIKNVSQDMGHMEQKVGDVFEQYESHSRKWMNKLITTQREIQSSRDMISNDVAKKLDAAFTEAREDLANKIQSVSKLNKQLGQQWGSKQLDSEIASLWQVDFQKLERILEAAEEADS